MKITIDSLQSGSRGLLILPTNFDPSDVNKEEPFYSATDLSVHMFCLNYEGKILNYLNY